MKQNLLKNLNSIHFHFAKRNQRQHERCTTCKHGKPYDHVTNLAQLEEPYSEIHLYAAGLMLKRSF